MSHRIGTVHTVTPIVIGPDSGSAPSSLNTWAVDFTPEPAPTGTKFVILHFTDAQFPGANRLEVDLGYGTDTFTAADGPDCWTRPVRVPGSGKITIRYITAGAGGGHVNLHEYGRGEPMESANTTDPNFHNHTNPDVFLLDSPYVEPSYELRGFCGSTPNWENIACVPAGDVRASVARSVCLFVHIEHSEANPGEMDVSSCTGTLIGPNLVLCAGHCVSNDNDLNGLSGSVTFDFQTNCDGTRPAGYNCTFHKVNKTFRWRSSAGLDYSLLQLKTTPGVPAVPMRHDLPKAGDEVFEVHHPQAITKKVSARHNGPQATISKVGYPTSVSYRYIYANCDLTGGSSGSALFDAAGRIIGIADLAGKCENGFLSITEVLADLAATPATAIKRDVMLVLDRSGSMAMDAGTGRTKIEEARDAASLFVQLIRSGAGDRVGLASFSTTASLDEALGIVDAAKKSTLVGPPPFGGGKVGALSPDGVTTIGGGLQTANGQFPAPGAGVNKKTILLMTDGLQNTPPMVADVNPSLGGVDLSIIGFGTESSLDGVLLNQLAQEHGGLYTRAGTGLQLKKFFVLAFGNIFETGTLSDPEYDMPAEQHSQSISFSVCGEDRVTVVLGWADLDASLAVELKTPSGTTITTSTAGVEWSSGRAWVFLRVPLPIAGERNGTWQAVVFRPAGGEFPPPPVATRFFVNVVASGGPVLRRLNSDLPYYTGDPINPLLMLYNSNGSVPDGAEVKLTMTRPIESVGTLLSQSTLGPAATLKGDVIPARQATLQATETSTGHPAVTYTTVAVDLYDDGAHEDGAMEPDGIFGDVLPDLLITEGTYTFHAIATYGDGCAGTREAIWSMHIDVGIDPGKSEIVVKLDDPAPDGSRSGASTITPKDKYGNKLGPGRGDSISVSGAPGTIVTGPVIDNGDGTYTVPVSTDPSAGGTPGVLIGQPGRPPALVGSGGAGKGNRCCRWKLFVCLLLLLIILLLLLLLLT